MLCLLEKQIIERRKEEKRKIEKYVKNIIYLVKQDKIKIGIT